MFIKPPVLVQPQEEQKIPQDNSPLEAISIENINKTITSAPNNPPTIIPQNKEIFIRKKRQYRTFIRMVKEGKYISARITAEVLGVDPQTIKEWNNTKKAQEAIAFAVDYHIERMRKVGDRDWKMHDKMIDRLQGSITKEENKADLQQMIVINT